MRGNPLPVRGMGLIGWVPQGGQVISGLGHIVGMVALYMLYREKYERVFGIAQLDIHGLQLPPSSDMDTTCHFTIIVVNTTGIWR